jgi:tetratricopeptide (TPR) repeat protein
LAALCVREFDAAMAAASTAPAEHETQPATPPAPPYELLRTALQSAPGYGPAFERLENELYREGAEGREGLHQFLLELLANGEQPAVIHRLLGLRASALEDWPTAVQHFDQAIRLVPNDPFLLNNLAYSSLQTETSADRIRRAEWLATEALQLAPEHPEILATRGEIRVRLKRYEDAIADLQKSVAMLPRRAHLQLLLAECYEELGMTTLAKVCREKALKAESPPE